MLSSAVVGWVTATAVVPPAQSSLLEPEKRLCLLTAFQAAKICLSAPRVCARTKSDASPVSAADIAIQATVAHALCEVFPGDALVAEEDSDMVLSNPQLTFAAQLLVDFDIKQVFLNSALMRGADSARCWTLDPIDGTKGFLSSRGYAVGLALLGTTANAGHKGYPSLAALTLPHEEIVLLAEPGGSGLQEVSLQSSPSSATKEALHIANTGRPSQNDTYQERFEDFVWLMSGAEDLVLDKRPAWKFLCCGSLIKYAAVARQRAAAFVQVLDGRWAHVWDHAAGVAVVMASGGNVTDETGQQLTIGYGSRRQEVHVQPNARAIVATAEGVDHALFCREVQTALKARISS